LASTREVEFPPLVRRGPGTLACLSALRRRPPRRTCWTPAPNLACPSSICTPPAQIRCRPDFPARLQRSISPQLLDRGTPRAAPLSIRAQRVRTRCEQQRVHARPCAGHSPPSFPRFAALSWPRRPFHPALASPAPEWYGEGRRFESVRKLRRIPCKSTVRFVDAANACHARALAGTFRCSHAVRTRTGLRPV
jgi:hypothetical protein